MSRLVTFGCSFTYGAELPDCQNPESLKNTPSEYAWPQLAAQQLNLECVNTAEPGFGNKHILHEIINFDFLPSDIVIVLWSFFNRHCVITENHTVVDLGPWHICSDSSYASNASAAYYKDPGLHSTLDDIFTNVLYIQHAHNFLKNRGVTAIHASIPGPVKSLNTLYRVTNPRSWGALMNNKDGLDLIKNHVSMCKKWNDIRPEIVFNDAVRFGKMPGGHPGLKAHQSFAGRLVKHIEQKRQGTSTWAD